MKIRVMLLFFLSLVSLQPLAQLPDVNPVGNDIVLAGSQVCLDTQLSNSNGEIGHGPYLQLILPVEVTFDSASFFMTGATATDIGVFPAPPSNQLQDTIIDQPVTGPEGFQLILIQPPIGSLALEAPNLNLELCFTLEPSVAIGVPLNVLITPVFGLGIDAFDNQNVDPPILGFRETFVLVPILVIFDKSNNAPEQERPPGPSWPVTYTLNTDVADEAALENVVIADTLPANFVLDVASIMVTGGVNCVVGPGPNISVTCDSVTGTDDPDDLVVTYSGYFDDVLDETFCDVTTDMNSATFDADFNGSAIPQESDSDVIQLSHLLVQKNVDTSDTPPDPDLVNPGETITYTLDLQVTDFGTSDSLVITDILPDGLTFDAHISFIIGGVPVAIVPTVTPGGAGQTIVEYDLIPAIGENIASGSAIKIIYTATVNTIYDSGDSVLPNDVLVNRILASYNLFETNILCSDLSLSGVIVSPVVPTKSVVSTGPYLPGDTITYRLSMVTPSGNTRNVVFRDFLPAPFIDVRDIDPSIGTDIRLSPLDTLGLTPISSIDIFNNSLIIEWPDVTTGSLQTISVDVDVTITTDPFAVDNLGLSNLLQVDSDNTQGEPTTGVESVSIQVRAPDLTITKGVVAADQGKIVPSPVTLPVDGDVTGVDAGDVITFQLTIENIGGAQAFDTFVSDPAIPELVNCAVVTVLDGTGAELTTAPAAPLIDPGFTITTPLAANDDNPADGGAPYAADTAIVTYTCEVVADVEPGQLIENTARVIWASEVGGTIFPPLIDTAKAQVDEPSMVKSRTDTVPDPDGNDTTVTIGEIIEYTVVINIPEGEFNATLVDTLDTGLVFQSFDNLVPSPGLSTTATGGFAGVLSNATGTGGTNAVLDFFIITNSNTDNAVAETITIEYTVLVTDIPANVDGSLLNNQAVFNYLGGSVDDDTSNVTIVEPVLNIVKSAMPVVADAGDIVTYTVVLSHDILSNSEAFNVEMIDIMADPNLTLIDGSVTTTQGTVITGNGGGADTKVVVDVGNIPMSGPSVTITFQATIGNGVSSGQMIPNTAAATFESLPMNGRVYVPIEATALVVVDHVIFADGFE